ncbi:MAG: hypothetical protein FWD16_05555 [Clostridia bacterium]|nr:hypothetical protein [Clostridia bacterium]
MKKVFITGPTVFFVLLTIWQGGYSSVAWCLTGVALCLYFLFKPCALHSKTPLFIMLGLAACYALSTVLSGNHAEGYLGIIKVIVFILCYLYVTNARPNIENAVYWAGLVVAVIGLLSFCGILPWSGATVQGRLFSVFQYANGAGIFLAVCAFFTRLASKKSDNKTDPAVVIMETALLLTQSVGGLALYIIGWIIYSIAKKENIARHLCGFLLAAVMAAGMLYLAQYTTLPYLAVLIPVAYFALNKITDKGIQIIARQKWIVWGMVALIAAAGTGLLIARQFTPLATFAERLVQITDGFNAMLRHPIGLGPGAWAFTMRSFQTYNYTATLVHSGYVHIGLAGGFLGLGCVIALLVYCFRRWRPDKYGIAALILLIHVFMDFSLAFLSLSVLLLSVCAAFVGNEPKKVVKRGWWQALFIVPLIACVLLYVPETVKNRARRHLGEGDHAAAISTLEKGFLLPNDTQATLLTIRVAVAAGDHNAADEAYARMRPQNAEAHYWMALSCANRGDYDQAVEYALNCAINAPFWEGGQNYLSQVILPALSQQNRDDFLARLEAIKLSAQQNAHPLSQVIMKGYQLQ